MSALESFYSKAASYLYASLQGKDSIGHVSCEHFCVFHRIPSDYIKGVSFDWRKCMIYPTILSRRPILLIKHAFLCFTLLNIMNRWAGTGKNIFFKCPWRNLFEGVLHACKCFTTDIFHRLFRNLQGKYL